MSSLSRALDDERDTLDSQPRVEQDSQMVAWLIVRAHAVTFALGLAVGASVVGLLWALVAWG